MWVCSYAHVWRPKVGIRSLPWSIYILIIEVDLLAEHGAHWYRTVQKTILLWVSHLCLLSAWVTSGKPYHQLLCGFWRSKSCLRASWQALCPLCPLFIPNKPCYLLTPLPLLVIVIQSCTSGLMSPTIHTCPSIFFSPNGRQRNTFKSQVKFVILLLIVCICPCNTKAFLVL